ncbi:hypothetical protein E9531_14060 [Lampropedia puyangensis]|uniref:Uncharacterized protein n=1 Tax=Lampropedia puyangensis TaxID=1330072 RepID=A0A4S8EXT2_9BURK|nr:hypothetical protein [Lampropedia puyangensis]THT98694.1 hypothetical protein E9531_14060 [Lampropedia puyangensis]
MHSKIVATTAVSVALLLGNAASAQSIHGYDRGGYAYYPGANYQGAYGHGPGQRPYNGYSHRPDYSHRPSSGRSSRDAGLALGALVVGGILGYAISQSNASPSAALSGPYPSYTAPQPSYGDATYGQPYPVAPSANGYAAPVYSQPYASGSAVPVTAMPVQGAAVPQYQTVVVNGRTYYRPTAP